MFDEKSIRKEEDGVKEKDMQEAGVQLIGLGNPPLFVHPKSTHGVLVQLTEKK
jgi:hypothetical protein